jgi:hypothetical protein
MYYWRIKKISVWKFFFDDMMDCDHKVSNSPWCEIFERDSENNYQYMNEVDYNFNGKNIILKNDRRD